MKTYQSILLDWDGSLAKTLDIWLNAYKNIFAQYNLFPSNQEISRDAFGDWNAGTKFGIKDNKEFTKKILQFVKNHYTMAPLYPGVKDVLKQIKASKKKTALLTSSSKILIKPALEKAALSSIFDVVITAEDVHNHKPDPEAIVKAMTMLGEDRSSAIIIGDSKNDLGAAKNAGIDSILFYPEENKLYYNLEELKIYEPTYIVNDFSNILDVIT